MRVADRRRLDNLSLNQFDARIRIQ